MYAEGHGGKFPPKLSDLEPDYLTEEILARLPYKDPTSGKLVEPIYFPGYTVSTPHSTMLLGSTLSGGKRVVLYADGSAVLERDGVYQERLKKQPPSEW
jgi:hypothetical protein